MAKIKLDVNSIYQKLDSMDGSAGDGKITNKVWNIFASVAGGKEINYYILEKNAKRSIGYYLANASETKLQKISEFFESGKVPVQEQPSNSKQKEINNNKKWSGNIDGKVGNTSQGQIGDCWLLSTLNSMRETDWGRKAISDALRPDGHGGAIVTFKLDNGKTKELHISISDIRNARARGLCSVGDDDVATLELAFQRHFGSIDGGGKEQQVVKLLCGESCKHHVYSGNNQDMDRLIEEVEKNPNKYCVTVGVLSDSTHLYGNHAYQLRKVTTDKRGKKWLHLVNPWNSSRTIKVSADEYKLNALDFLIIENKSQPSEHLKTGEEKQREKENEELISRNIRNELDLISSITDINRLKNNINKLNNNNILLVFNSDEIISKVIKSIDKYKSGWGNGKDKKALILPIVNKLCAKAKSCNVSQSIIDDVKNKCIKELDATFYTNENVIISALQQLRRCILQKNKN